MLRYFAKLQVQHQLIFAVIIGIAMVSFWRGMFGLENLYLFPENPPLSYMVSLIAGFAILIASDYVIKKLA
ncbi:MAG: hypothetical protein V1676_02875 [Candidatus Diapherotrites archaeon]